MLGDAPIEFGALGFGKQERPSVGNDAFPQLLGQRHAILDGQLVNTEGFCGNRHGASRERQPLASR